MFNTSAKYNQNSTKEHKQYSKKTTIQREVTSQSKVLAFIQLHGYHLSRNFNMDETPTCMWFEMLSCRTLKFSSSRTVSVKSCSTEKPNSTVLLAVAADRAKLPPIVIYLRQNTRKKSRKQWIPTTKKMSYKLISHIAYKQKVPLQAITN